MGWESRQKKIALSILLGSVASVACSCEIVWVIGSTFIDWDDVVYGVGLLSTIGADVSISLEYGESYLAPVVIVLPPVTHHPTPSL
jgi:hypothetical protein